MIELALGSRVEEKRTQGHSGGEEINRDKLYALNE